MNSHIKQPPKAVGLYDPRFEHDSCGVGMVARLDNRPTHEVIERAITALENLEHRGASGADACTGDGAGILMQMPDALLRAAVEFELPDVSTAADALTAARAVLAACAEGTLSPREACDVVELISKIRTLEVGDFEARLTELERQLQG